MIVNSAVCIFKLVFNQFHCSDLFGMLKMQNITIAHIFIIFISLTWSKKLY